MDFDISHLLNEWEHQAGHVVARRFTAKNGQEKIQLRLDLGLLQMNAEGRPDGKRPYGRESLYEHYQARLQKYVAAHDSSDEGFKLNAEDCVRLQVEALQYHHRYVCLLQLEDYVAVIRDASRNLAVFDFVSKHAECEEFIWSFQQFRPQLLMILTRARAAQAFDNNDYASAVREVEEGLEAIRTFFHEHARAEAAEMSGEVQSLEKWLEEIRARRPLSPKERLERALLEAINSEDYEGAAKVRDALRNLKPAK